MLKSIKDLFERIGVSEERGNEILVQILETIAKNLNEEEQKKLDQFTSELSDKELSEIGGGRAMDSTREWLEKKCSKLATKISHGLDRLSEDFSALGDGSFHK